MYCSAKIDINVYLYFVYIFFKTIVIQKIIMLILKTNVTIRPQINLIYHIRSLNLSQYRIRFNGSMDTWLCQDYRLLRSCFEFIEQQTGKQYLSNIRYSPLPSPIGVV